VVALDQLSPPRIAQLDELRGGADDVGEEDRGEDGFRLHDAERGDEPLELRRELLLEVDPAGRIQLELLRAGDVRREVAGLFTIGLRVHDERRHPDCAEDVADVDVGRHPHGRGDCAGTCGQPSGAQGRR
jgi:hypothetical protein